MHQTHGRQAARRAKNEDGRKGRAWFGLPCGKGPCSRRRCQCAPACPGSLGDGGRPSRTEALRQASTQGAPPAKATMNGWRERGWSRIFEEKRVSSGGGGSAAPERGVGSGRAGWSVDHHLPGVEVHVVERRIVGGNGRAPRRQGRWRHRWRRPAHRRRALREREREVTASNAHHVARLLRQACVSTQAGGPFGEWGYQGRRGGHDNSRARNYQVLSDPRRDARGGRTQQAAAHSREGDDNGGAARTSRHGFEGRLRKRAEWRRTLNEAQPPFPCPAASRDREPPFQPAGPLPLSVPLDCPNVRRWPAVRSERLRARG